MSNEPLTNTDGEVRELTAEDMTRFRPFAELHPELAAVLPKRRPGERGPGLKPTKQSVSLRLSPEVVEHFKAGGPGWQSRIDATLREAVRKAG